MPTSRCRRARWSKCALAVFVALPFIPGVARAADDAGAQAEVLFREGKRLMDAGDFASACPKLAESQRLDPGNGTLARLATCHEKEGRTATAWSEFAELVTSAERAGQADREKFAKQRIAVLQAQLSHLTLRVPADVAALPGLRVQRDGIDVGEAAWGVAVPVDPGDHRIEASAPGRKPWSTTVSIGTTSDEREAAVPMLSVLEVVPSAAATVASPIAPAPQSHDEVTRATSGNAQRTVGVVIGAAGVVALGIGTYLGIRAISDANDAKSACPEVACPSAAAVQQNDAAKSNALAADVVLPVGLAAAVGGSLLYFLAPRAPRLEPVVGRVNGLRFTTTF
jgi:hypothetical protein